MPPPPSSPPSLAGWAGWSVQGWRLGEQIAALKTAQAEAVNTAAREARAQESKRFRGSARCPPLPRPAPKWPAAMLTAARGEFDRLRDTIRATAGGVPGESTASCTQRADTSADLHRPVRSSVSRPGGNR